MRSVPPAVAGGLVTDTQVLEIISPRRLCAHTDFFACDGSLGHGPTRYREVVLTSSSRGMSVGDRDPPATAWWY
jgi:hypothetical protein